MCNGCGAVYAAPPTKGRAKAKGMLIWTGQCLNVTCQRLDYERFDTSGEQQRYAHLLLRQTAGLISGLRRQVRYPLYTIDETTGLKVGFAVYIADYVYLNEGKLVIEDWKPVAGSDPEARLKMRIMEASGRPVQIVTDKGVV